MILATTALRISKVAGLEVGDVDLAHGRLTVRRRTYPNAAVWSPGRPKLAAERSVPIIDPLRQTLARLTSGRARMSRLLR